MWRVILVLFMACYAFSVAGQSVTVAESVLIREARARADYGQGAISVVLGAVHGVLCV